MGRIGRNGKRFAAAHDALLSGDDKPHQAAFDHRNLLVHVLMQRNDSTLPKADARDGHGLAVDHLAGDGWAHLLFGNLGPVVMFHDDPVFYHGDS